MPKEKDTGGPAFPGPFTGHCGNENHASPCGCYLDSGMTLRDWFAGMALQGLLANSGSPSYPEKVATFAYTMADAMLEERKR